MINSDNGSILEEIVNSVAIVYKWKDYYQPVIKNVIKVPDTILNTYVGKYGLGGGTIATIKRGDKGLIVNAFGNMDWNIYFTSDTDFFVKEYRAELRFVMDHSGRVSGFTANGNLAKKIE
jgi:hypothetical protein